MAQQATSAVQNNFTKGLVTEYTGLNFPENAATDCDNVTFTLVGDVTRRSGFAYEPNHASITVDRTGKAQSSFKWNNAGGDGNTQIVVEQIGSTLYFYRSSTATVASPLSTQILGSNIDVSAFVAVGGTFDPSKECQYTSGNGYLFVYHPTCDPFYCTYNAGTIAGNRITVQIRDVFGLPEASVPDNLRPTSLTVEHNYNLVNQGWVSGNPWAGFSTSVVTVGLGAKTFTVAAGLTVTLGELVNIIVNHPNNGGSALSPTLPAGAIMTGNVTAYAGTTMTINVTSGAAAWFGNPGNDWIISPINRAYLTTWNTSIGNYPSNSDVWWYFKNSSGVFDPATTLANVSLGAGKGPRGHNLLDAFSQQRSLVSGLVGLTPIQTTVRPKLGCWFQGRVWYTGVDAQQPATGDAPYYTWTENLYFSQVVNTTDDFGHCYQKNDPTSESLFDLLPTDGGVIQIQGIGSIYKLHPIQNGLLVFGANGIKFITGSQGVGFSANDYTIIDVSDIRAISSTSFVTVNGLPVFWNEEGIYQVLPPSQQGFGFQVQSLTYSTIDTLYSEIPMSSKRYVRGDYDPINYTIQWLYRDTEAPDVAGRYNFNKILNFNTSNKCFYPYTISAGVNVNGIVYVTHPGGSTAPLPKFKYYTSTGSAETFAEEVEGVYTDWGSVAYESYFVTGYQLSSKALTKFQPTYVYVFSRTDDYTEFGIQSLWDYATSADTGRWSVKQHIVINKPNYGMDFRRVKIRGHGMVLQLKFTSSEGVPFDIMGWSMPIQMNTGV